MGRVGFGARHPWLCLYSSPSSALRGRSNFPAWVLAFTKSKLLMGFPGGASGREPTCQCRRHKRPGFDPLEEGKATRSSILAWWIPWTEGVEGYSAWGLRETDTTEAMQHVSCRYKPPIITWLDKEDNFQKFPMTTFHSNYDKTNPMIQSLRWYNFYLKWGQIL